LERAGLALALFVSGNGVPMAGALRTEAHCIVHAQQKAS